MGKMLKKKVTAVVLFGTADIPAKAAFMNMKSHAGHESCPKCQIYGEKSTRTGQVMVFPHVENLVLRSDTNFHECAAEAVRLKKDVKGIYGPTVLSYMLYSSFMRSTSIDSMHCTALRIVKQLLKLWFNPKFSNEPFSLVTSVDYVNKQLKNLRLPHFVQRLPEDVTKRHYWKPSLC